MMAAGFFVISGALLVTRDLVLPFILPGLSRRRPAGRAHRSGGGLLPGGGAGDLFAAGGGGLRQPGLPLSVQMLPALLGLAFLRWVSRSAILTGLILGGLAVFFTEPPGLYPVRGPVPGPALGPLADDHPFRRLGIGAERRRGAAGVDLHRKGAERLHRDRLHDEFAARWRVDFGGRGARGATWSLTLIWAFFALGPGAILGNSFFSRPIFTEAEASLGLPSLWAWQLFFWLIGVPLVWWLAYRCRLGLTGDEGLRRLAGGADRPLRAPGWIAASLARVTGR